MQQCLNPSFVDPLIAPYDDQFEEFLAETKIKSNPKKLKELKKPTEKKNSIVQEFFKNISSQLPNVSSSIISSSKKPKKLDVRSASVALPLSPGDAADKKNSTNFNSNENPEKRKKKKMPLPQLTDSSNVEQEDFEFPSPVTPEFEDDEDEYDTKNQRIEKWVQSQNGIQDPSPHPLLQPRRSNMFLDSLQMKSKNALTNEEIENFDFNTPSPLVSQMSKPFLKRFNSNNDSMSPNRSSPNNSNKPKKEPHMYEEEDSSVGAFEPSFCELDDSRSDYSSSSNNMMEKSPSNNSNNIMTNSTPSFLPNVKMQKNKSHNSVTTSSSPLNALMDKDFVKQQNYAFACHDRRTRERIGAKGPSKHIAWKTFPQPDGKTPENEKTLLPRLHTFRFPARPQINEKIRAFSKSNNYDFITRKKEFSEVENVFIELFDYIENKKIKSYPHFLEKTVEIKEKLKNSLENQTDDGTMISMGINPAVQEMFHIKYCGGDSSDGNFLLSNIHEHMRPCFLEFAENTEKNCIFLDILLSRLFLKRIEDSFESKLFFCNVLVPNCSDLGHFTKKLADPNESTVCSIQKQKIEICIKCLEKVEQDLLSCCTNTKRNSNLMKESEDEEEK